MSSHKYFEEKIRNSTLWDDFLFRQVFARNMEAVQLALRVILDDPELEVLECGTQQEIPELFSRSLVLDVLARDRKGRHLNIEVMKGGFEQLDSRMRVHQHALDTLAIPKGLKQYNDIDETVIVFLCEKDTEKAGLPLYHQISIIEETGRRVRDRTEKIIVNGERLDENELGQLMKDFQQTDPEQMHYKVLSDSVKYYKEAEEGKETMSNMLRECWEEGKQEGRAEGRAEGREEGREEERKNSASRFNQLIAKLTEQKRFDDLARSSTEPEYQQKLFEELGLI